MNYFFTKSTYETYTTSYLFIQGTRKNHCANKWHVHFCLFVLEVMNNSAHIIGIDHSHMTLEMIKQSYQSAGTFVENRYGNELYAHHYRLVAKKLTLRQQQQDTRQTTSGSFELSASVVSQQSRKSRQSFFTN